jgi:glycosyltransferase involved in cell wall biosynthesis
MKLVTGLPQPLFELAEVAYNLVALVRVGSWLRRNRDVDFIYERYSLFMYSTILLARWFGVPVILEVNDSAAVERVRPLSLRALALAIERRAFRDADGLVFVSAAFRDRAHANQSGIAPSIVTHNAADIAKFTFTPEQRETTRARYGLQQHVVCGYLGAFVPWHAIDAFVKRIAPHLAAAPQLKLLLVGDGATYPALRAFIEERGLSSRVIMTGRVPHDAVPGLLSAMDMAILPSAGDYTSPVKLFEFMACGIPPVAPDFAPIQEVLDEGRTGWMFSAGDLDAAVSTVLDRSRDPGMLARVGAAARGYVAANRQWRHNVLQLVAFHQALIEGNGPK